MNKAEATAKLNQLIKAKKIGPREVALVEGRINSGADLPDYMFEEIKE